MLTGSTLYAEWVVVELMERVGHMLKKRDEAGYDEGYQKHDGLIVSS